MRRAGIQCGVLPLLPNGEKMPFRADEVSGEAANALSASEGQSTLCRVAPSSDPSGHLLPAGRGNCRSICAITPSPRLTRTNRKPVLHHTLKPAQERHLARLRPMDVREFAVDDDVRKAGLAQKIDDGFGRHLAGELHA